MEGLLSLPCSFLPVSPLERTAEERALRVENGRAEILCAAAVVEVVGGRDFYRMGKLIGDKNVRRELRGSVL